jgi:AcrR family transcriptional regulator
MRAPAGAIHCASHKLHRVDLADRISFDIPKHLAAGFQPVGAEPGQHLSHDHAALVDLFPPLAPVQPTHSLRSSPGLTTRPRTEQQDGIGSRSSAAPTRCVRQGKRGSRLPALEIGRDGLAATLCNVSISRPSRTRRTATGERRAAYDPETLLEVAARVFTDRGYDGTSMEHLAEAAGITKSSIYHHVPGKEALLRAALDRALDALFAVCDEPHSTTGAAIERLEHVIRRSVEILDEELPYVTLLLRVRGNTGTEQDALERRRTFDRFVTKLVAEAAHDGDLAPEIDPGLTTRLVFGMINSISEWYHPGRGVTVHELADAVVALTLRR